MYMHFMKQQVLYKFITCAFFAFDLNKSPPSPPICSKSVVKMIQAFPYPSPAQHHLPFFP